MPRSRALAGHSGDDGGGNAFIGFCPDGANADGTSAAGAGCIRASSRAVANHNAMQIDPLRDIVRAGWNTHTTACSRSIRRTRRHRRRDCV